VEGLIELENPNRVKQKMKKVSQLDDPTLGAAPAAAAAAAAPAKKAAPGEIQHLLIILMLRMLEHPDSTYHADADPDSDFYLMQIRIRIRFHIPASK
jgi:hypothetical protein